MPEMTEQKLTKTHVELLSGKTLSLRLTDKQIYNLVQTVYNGGVFVVDGQYNARAYIPGDKVVLVDHEYTDMRDGSV